MAKNSVEDWSSTAGDNADVGGIAIVGGSAVSNFDNALRTIMAQLATFRTTGTLVDTVAFTDPAAPTKKVRLDAGNVTAGQTRVLTMPDANVTVSSFAATFLDDTSLSSLMTTLGLDAGASTNSAALPMSKAPPEMTWLSNSSIRIAAGACRDDADTFNIVVPTSVDITGIAAGNNSHRHIWVGIDGNGNVNTVVTSQTNVTAKYRRVGSIRTDASGNVIRFIQQGDQIDLQTPVLAFDGTGSGSYANLTVPVGFGTFANLVMNANNSVNSYVVVIPTDVAAPGALAANGWTMLSIYGPGYSAGQYQVRADAAGQVRHAATTGMPYRIYVLGWIDRRGRDK